jgi:hypothetical protein
MRVCIDKRILGDPRDDFLAFSGSVIVGNRGARLKFAETDATGGSDRKK